jgi:hypothetical protein
MRILGAEKEFGYHFVSDLLEVVGDKVNVWIVALLSRQIAKTDDFRLSVLQ